VPRLTVPRGRPQWYAYYIAVPLAVLTVVLAIPLAGRSSVTVDQLLLALLLLGLMAVSQAFALTFQVRRHTVGVTLGEIPLLLALFYLSPILVIVVRALACLALQVFQRNSLVKTAYNIASVSVAAAVAASIVARFPSDTVTPRTWLVLAVAVASSSVISLAAVLGVICLVQGIPPVRNLAQASVSVLVVTGANIMLGLIVLQVLQGEPWSIVLLAGLVALLVIVYRSYATFTLQHRSLTELYELTQAMADAARNGTLPDVLLGRTRELLQAEWATLWLPAAGRFPRTLLSARVDAPGLLDHSPTPAVLRERAVADGKTLIVGPKVGDSGLRVLLRSAGVKDAIVVPLRSGSAVIGSLEVAGRLGEYATFGREDVRLLQTLAAHAAVAVENSRLVDRLLFDAYHDALTRLPNRRRVLAQLEEAVRVRAHDEVVAVLAFDISGLRNVNDAFGHDAGDQVVREVADRLRGLAPAAALVGRSGSDEFLITVRLPDVSAAVALAETLRDAVQQPLSVGEISLQVDVAVGVAVYPDHAADPESLVRRAGLAAQTAKNLTTPIRVYHPSQQARSSHRLELAADLRRALDDGQVSVTFQPKVSLPDRRVVGVECLARWEHPAHGEVAPDEFVAIAEHTGQLGRLTELVVREGLRRARGWLEAGRELPVAVNVSPRTVVDPTFPSRLAGLLEEYGVPPRLVTLEIREQGLLGETERSLANVRRLADLGVRLAVDDFGTGHASLTHLRRMPLHEVKIDRSIIAGMATDEGDLATVRAVVLLAKHLGLVSVAEGVENERTVSLLEELGCGVGQGFLFSRALPYERFEAWLATQTLPAPVTVLGPRAEVTVLEPRSDGDGRRLRVVP
jgi:diguanylate cyclase (GGDEF)-like protein